MIIAAALAARSETGPVHSSDIMPGPAAPATTVDVSSATLGAVSGITALSSGPKAALVATLQDAIAPSLVETGAVLLSFADGKLSKLKSAAFQPGAGRAVPAGIAAAIVANDGTTPFTL